MRILILGGNAWLGRYTASAAMAAGHQVTCLVRGESGSPPQGAALVRADRNLPGAYAEVQQHRWDSVVDVSRQPGQVRGAAAALAHACKTFIFVSSASVYADHQAPGQDESAALLPALDAEVMQEMDQYGPVKVACEQHVLAAFGADRALIARVGLIGGPGDVSDRSGYWPLRFSGAAATGRAVLVPDTPQAATQVIDVRDLARWLVGCVERGVSGTFNAAGETTAFEDFIAAARHAAAHSGPVQAASSDWLLEHEVSPWAGPRSLPLWIPMESHAGFSARSSARAALAGLTRRPLQDTLRDTLEWELSRNPPPAPRRAGLSDEDESELLRALRPLGP